MSTSNGSRLPRELREPTGPARREPGASWTDVGPAHADVAVCAVWMGRQGWRHEVTVTFDAIDPPTVDADGQEVDAGGPVRRQDALWLGDAGDAQRVALAAVDELRAGAFTRDDVGELHGLSAIARRLGITTPLR